MGKNCSNEILSVLESLRHFLMSASVGFRPRARTTSPKWLLCILSSPRSSNSVNASLKSLKIFI
ncbi:hypothetical protein BpHYR1_018484 [Brachionus plicatilis]|uniref:Uncharacterized protein n=1 Tax=Brachionus plicatilis TaxID=10195 RepID=A0A3M7PZL5_BRAPC|nr:hypothetical protein BpHYR1_018484 [Brachionus plicatilis]